MRNSTILVTLAIAVAAGSLGYALSQAQKSNLTDPATTTLEQSADTNTAQNDTVAADTNTTTASATPAADTTAATTMTTAETAATNTSATDTAVDETTTAAAATTTSDTAADTAAAETATTPDTTTTDTAAATTTPATEAMTPTTLDSQAPAAGEATTAAEEAPAEEPRPEMKFNMDVKAALQDRSIGSPTAPITVEDYSSLSCPHCAAFHNEILPEVKKNYIDTGKVRWIFRGFPLNDPAMKAEMLTRCAPKEQYTKLQDLIYQNQVRWAFTDDPLPNLNMLLRIAGISDEMFLSCVNNKEIEAGLAKKIAAAADKYKINSTPTFVMNKGAKTFSGAGTYTGFAYDLDNLLKDINEKKATPATTVTQ